jgi:hypothetical protein
MPALARCHGVHSGARIFGVSIRRCATSLCVFVTKKRLLAAAVDSICILEFGPCQIALVTFAIGGLGLSRLQLWLGLKNLQTLTMLNVETVVFGHSKALKGTIDNHCLRQTPKNHNEVILPPI